MSTVSSGATTEELLEMVKNARYTSAACLGAVTLLRGSLAPHADDDRLAKMTETLVSKKVEKGRPKTLALALRSLDTLTNFPQVEEIKQNLETALVWSLRSASIREVTQVKTGLNSLSDE